MTISAPAAPLGTQTPAVVPRPRAPRPDEDVIPAVESVAGADGKFRRERLVRREFQYPLIRIEEVVQRTATGEQVVQRVEMVADHVLVSAAPGIDHLAMEKVAARHGVQVRSRVPGTKNYLLRFAAEDHQSLARAKTALTGDPALRVVEPDYVVHHMVTPDDPQFGQLWGLDNQGQTGGTADADIDAPEAWQLGTGSHTVRVGVIDTGIDYTHPDLAANIWTNPGESGTDGLGNDKRTNGVDDDANGFVDDWHGWDFVNNDNDPMDDHYHGTHCAGTIGAVGGNGTGITGVCWQVSLVGLKFLDAGGSGTTSAAIAAVTYANQLGLDLTSNSWGGGGFSQALKDAIDAAGVQGKLFVVAAGNSSGDNDVYPVYPASYTSDNLIAVAATSSNDAMAYFSCYGATSVDLGAPGVDVYSTKPGNTYGLLSGTSMATPHVAGACALLKAINPGLSGAQIKTTLLTYSDPTPAMQGKVLSNGRLNLAAAAVSVSGPHLIAEATVLSDIPVVDGIISPGETVLVSVTLRNSGSETASGVTAALATSDGFLSVVQPTVSYGTVAAGAQVAPDQPAVVVVSSPLTTPQVATLALVVNGQDPDGDPHTWTIPVTFTVATAATISGQVVRTTGGAPVAGASVTFSGPSAGTVTTAADGSFSRVVMDGTHTLVAFASDLSPSAPQVITTPPGATNVVFSLGAPDITVDPTALTVVVGQGETATSQFAIGNSGDQPLHAELQVQSGVWETTGLWHRSSWRDHGVGQSWYYGSETTRSYNTGSRNAGNLTSVSVSVPVGAPVLSFWSWRVTEPGLTWDRSLVQVSVEGSGVWSTLLQLSDVSGTWQRHDLDLLAYAGQTVLIRFAFDTIDAIYNDFEGWYVDDVTINGLPVDGWLVLGSDTVDVAPATQESVSVTLAPGVREPGSYTQNILITSNDPDELQTLLPVTMVVEGRPSLVYGNSYSHDDGQQLGIGDSDGAIEPGESILFWPGVLNHGGAPAVDVTAVLSTSDPYINLPSATATYGTIVAGEILFGSGFLVEVAANCPLDHQVQFTLVVQDASNRQWTLSPAITVVSRSRVRGVVSDLATGAPISGATVSSSTFTTVTASDGTYLLNGLPPGTWLVTVDASGYTQKSSGFVVPGDATWHPALGFPVLEVSPPALSAVLNYGESVTHQLAISNPGNEPLTWSASFPYHASDYLIDNSDQPGGPAYVWNDIRTTGTAITGFYDDSNLGPIPLGFSFPFYDGTTTTMRVCSNGWLSPSNLSAQYSTAPLPSAYAPAPLIAFYWRDLYFYAGATAHYQQVDAGTFVLQFTNVGLYGSSSTLLTCQTVLKIDGSIIMYYQHVGDPNYGTVGIQNATATLGSTATHNQPFLHNNLAVRFRPATAGLSITPTSGTVAAGDSTTVAVTVDSVLRGVGLHEDVLTVTSNAPTNGVVQVPITTRVIYGSLPVVDPQTVFTLEDTQSAFTLTASDGDNDPLTFYVIEGPEFGVLGGSLPNLTYTPSPDWSGTDHLTVVVVDPYQTSDPVVIPIEVAPVNDPPSLSDPFPSQMAWVGQSFSAWLGTGAAVSDPDAGDVITLTLAPIDRPWPDGLGFDSNTWMFTGIPTVESLGVTHFLVTATDQAGGTASAHFFLDVRVLPTTAKLLADDGADAHRFATDVAFVDDDVVIGAPFAGARGQVYHFRRVEGSWQQQPVILPLGSDDLRFGSAVALHDGVLVVGSTVGEDVQLSTFEQSENGWQGVSIQVVPTASASVLPGTEPDPDHRVDLALSATALVVGTPFDASGSVRVFVRDGATWSQRNRINGGSQFQRLGWSVALSGDRLAAGAPRASFSVADTGAVLVATGITTATSDLTVQLPLTFETGAYFGRSVALDGETLVVGAPGIDGSGQDVGEAVVFTIQSGVWSYAQRLAPWFTYTPNSIGSSDWYGRFGAAVAVQGNRLMVGAPGASTAAAGEIHGYVRFGTAGFVRVQTSDQPDPAYAAGFGSVLAMDRDRVVVATPADDDRGVASGSAYVLTMHANHAPTLAGGSLTVSQNSSVQVTLAPQDVDGDAIGVQIVSGPAHGMVSIVGHLVRYVPHPGYTGADAFAVVAEDGSLASSPAVMAIEVTPYPEFSVTDFIQVEGDSGVTTRTLQAWLNIPSSETISIAWSTQGGNGSPDSDYLVSAGTLVFSPGMTHLTIPIPVIGDTLVEHDEVVLIALTSDGPVGSSRVDLQACKLEYSIVSPK